MLLHHGTTQARAEAIVRNGPDPAFREPGELTKAGGLSFARPGGPFGMGKPEVVARGKAVIFPQEGKAVILEVDVPDDIVRLGTDVIDEVRFEPGFGLEELRRAWQSLPKRILAMT